MFLILKYIYTYVYVSVCRYTIIKKYFYINIYFSFLKRERGKANVPAC